MTPKLTLPSQHNLPVGTPRRVPVEFLQHLGWLAEVGNIPVRVFPTSQPERDNRPTFGYKRCPGRGPRRHDCVPVIMVASTGQNRASRRPTVGRASV